ncbi:MAG: hypothetical protein COW65_00940 [Cytophagales bacterium CG18_big_fil_WC_8_21_14_2_50_42_9]|nr:MAG: hypothetical protein COW65_00940 [Cytophagales bacterium CG18_big_fil_WC_8_21_14_2_50_42_9]
MKLEDLEKRNIYQVPEHYFDKLPARVMARVQEHNVAGQNALWAPVKYTYLKSALAGLFLILIFVSIFVLSKQPAATANSTQLLAQISDKEALDYLATTDKLEMQDLSLLSQSNNDLSHEFIQVSAEDIVQELEGVDLQEIELN